MASILLPGVALVTGAGGTGKLVSPTCTSPHLHETPPDTHRLIPSLPLLIPGIGAAVVKALAHSGCNRLAITDINAATLTQTREDVAKINPEAHVVSLAGNISDSGFVDSLRDEVATAFGRLDYAVNCAGILGNDLRSTEMSVESFDTINNVNYKGSWLSSRAALRLMMVQEPLPEHPGQRGAIVNIASQLGIVGRPGAGKLLVDA